jgi:large subunit ribosomal protein L9
MRVLFLEDVAGVAQGGEVKEVKNGFARNYLLPQSLAVLATANAMQRTGRLKREAEDTRLKTLTDMRALAKELDGTQVNVEMRAGASGRLYGSVTNAVVAGRLSEMIGREIDRRTVEIADPIRETGRFTLRIALHQEVDANITVLVHPMGADPEEFLAGIVEDEERAAEPDESNEVAGDAQGAISEAEDEAEGDDAPSGDAESAEAAPKPAD